MDKRPSPWDWEPTCFDATFDAAEDRAETLDKNVKSKTHSHRLAIVAHVTLDICERLEVAKPSSSV